MKKVFFIIILLAVQASLYAAPDNGVTSCMGGFNGIRDLVLIIDKGTVVTKSSKAFLLNQKEWKKYDESEEFLVFKKLGFKSFEDEYELLIVSKDGEHISSYTAAKSSNGILFEMEEFKCSGF
ncbi:hypothetical protein [Brumicola pallidula]|uniref:hypothetical protein n=1 Tax=Brumicola pallidula TaxID=56807 RepID=UPI0012B66642|nr:hypothetical protein [Glaciecola pallidula]